MRSSASFTKQVSCSAQATCSRDDESLTVWWTVALRCQCPATRRILCIAHHTCTKPGVAVRRAVRSSSRATTGKLLERPPSAILPRRDDR